MDIHQAYQILKADPTDTDSSIASRYEIQHNQLKSKIDLAPNEALKEKFSTTLQDMEIAYAKVIRHRSGKDEVRSQELPITNQHIENNAAVDNKGELNHSSKHKEEIDKLKQYLKYAFFAAVFFSSSTVYYLLEYKKINIAYEKVLPEFKELKTFKTAFTTGSKLTIRNSDDISFDISYLEVWYLQMEPGMDTVITSKTFEVPSLEPGRAYSPTYTEKNSVKDITNWVFLYLNVQNENKKFGQGIHCSKVENGELKLSTK